MPTSLEAGAAAPDFRLLTIQGRPVALSDFRGVYVVLWLSRGIF